MENKKQSRRCTSSMFNASAKVRARQTSERRPNWVRQEQVGTQKRILDCTASLSLGRPGGIARSAPEEREQAHSLSLRTPWRAEHRQRINCTSVSSQRRVSDMPSMFLSAFLNSWVKEILAKRYLHLANPSWFLTKPDGEIEQSAKEPPQPNAALISVW